MRDLPAAVRAKAIDAGATAWLEGLPSRVGGLAHEWGLTIGPAFADATEAYVVAVTRADGSPAVLKVYLSRRAAASETTVLRVAGGCARLLRSSGDALLIERLGPPMSEMSVEQPRRLEILCDLARSFWRPLPAVDLPDAVTKAAALAGTITRRWAELGRPCSRAAVDQALRAAESRSRGSAGHQGLGIRSTQPYGTGRRPAGIPKASFAS